MIKKYRKVLSLRTKLFYWKIVCVKMSLKKKIEFLWNRGQKRLNPIKLPVKQKNKNPYDNIFKEECSEHDKIRVLKRVFNPILSPCLVLIKIYIKVNN